MKKSTNKLMNVYNNKWIKYIFIPFILLIFWIGSSVLHSSYIGFTTLTQNYGMNAITNMPRGKLLKNESVAGEFTATENDLGVLSIRFINNTQVAYDDQDILVFKIKEKGAKKWQYQNNYKSNAIFGVPFYPFGFPKFTNSKGKTYVFSITSLRGNQNNALLLNSSDPVLVSRYVFPRRELLANKKQFLLFMIKKITNSFTDIGFIVSSLIYGLPLFFYLLWIGISARIPGSRYHFLFIIPLLILLMFSLNIDLVTGVFLGIVGFWIIIITVLNVESNVSFFFAFLFFILAFGSVLIGKQDLAGRLSNWTYVFLIIGAVQLPWELKKTSDKKSNKNLFQQVNLVGMRKKK